MIIKYQSYWAAVKVLQREAALLGRLDTSNGTHYKTLYEKGMISSEEIAQRNHIERLHYEFSVMKPGHNPYPFCYVTIVPKNEHIGLNFIDEAGRNYLTYLFREGMVSSLCYGSDQ